MEKDQLSEERLSVALVHWAFPPCVGGVESHLWDYSMLLASRGVDVTVLTGTRSPSDPCHPAIRLAYHSALDLSPDMPPAADEPPLKEWFKEWLRGDRARGVGGIRLVHGHNLHHFSAAPARVLRELRDELNLRLLHTYHSLWQPMGGEHVRAAEACRGWDRHYAVSDFLAAACRVRLGVEAERRYLGVNTSTYADVPMSGVRQQPGRMLLPARLIPDKGAEVAILALRHLIAERKWRINPRLVLTDPGNTVDFHREAANFRSFLEELICEFGLRDHVEFAVAEFKQIRKMYEDASVVLYPSLFAEPMGLAPLEAMCAGRPVVASGIGGLQEGIGQDERVGFLVPERNPYKLADRLSLLLERPELAHEMGSRARRHVMSRFDLEQDYLRPMVHEYRRQLVTGIGGGGGC
ncbi:glycosyltransferase family 4 protein [Streptomyces sp. 351MFTsu5.1]|uniref:glycosyltransferase family 4 protein n=1 Tax=Streptomyces sp. 351MFTsu5.1 TaxID=1172180 RepID=UPI0007C54EA4|nr:glycosyltransferase family 4 protein [Streptomyces sp. 351MFTsu5.1]